MEEINGYIIKKEIAEGAFGKVCKCTKNDKEYAVKIIPLEEGVGITNLIELGIMSSFNHKNINKAKEIFVNDRNVYIFQKIAVSDLYERTKKNKYGRKEIKNWLYSITHALKTLHKHKIIHCDMKTSNILYFNDDDIKITDFGESIKVWDKNFKFVHETASPRFKSPEILNSEEWDEKIDIWALGCIFYEIYTGKKLFAFHESDLDLYLLAHKDFFSFMGNYDHTMSNKTKLVLIDGEEVLITYTPPSITREIVENMDIKFLNLIFSMLSILPRKRPTCTEILNSPFFRNIKPKKYRIKDYKINSTNFDTGILPMSNKLNNSLIGKKIIEITKKLLTTTNNITINEKDRILTSYFIAYKLVRGEAKVNGINDKIISYENIVCSNINYRLFIL